MHRLLLTLILTLPCVAALAEEVQPVHDGLRLNAHLEKADGSWPAGPVVLMTHGTLAHGGMEIIKGLQSMLQERGSRPRCTAPGYLAVILV